MPPDRTGRSFALANYLDWVFARGRRNLLGYWEEKRRWMRALSLFFRINIYIYFFPYKSRYIWIYTYIRQLDLFLEFEFYDWVYSR